MESTKPRRTLSFSLRALLVLLTIVCCVLGWETSIVRERRAALDEIKASSGAFQATLADDWVARHPPGMTALRTATVNPVRRWLGDKPVQEIWYLSYYQGYSDAQLVRLKGIFPEASFHESHPEPCHPGCFPAGTLVDTPAGPRQIEAIRVDDPLIAILGDGQATTVLVQSVFVTHNHLCEIATSDGGCLLTTQIQPLCTSVDKILPAGKLRPRDTLVRRVNGRLQMVEVESVTQTDRVEQVFNLVLGESEIFVAGGYLARSKPPAYDPSERPRHEHAPAVAGQ